jgi:hypothetical protein
MAASRCWLLALLTWLLVSAASAQQDQAVDPGCVDTPGWGNGFSCDPKDGTLCSDAGYTCAMYEQNWCSGGPYAAAREQQWALGAGFLHPEENCCVCGKGIEELDEALWAEMDECESRFGAPPIGGRRCPSYDVSKEASAHYKGNSNPARSAAQSNPCFQTAERGACEANAVCFWDPAAGGRLGTDARDASQCKLKTTAANYAEGWRLTAAADDPILKAKCLDGSAPLYFLKRGTGDGANKFYVHHEGGGWCYGDEGCGLRGKGAGQTQRKTPDGPLVYTNLGSTEQYVDSGQLDGGYWSSDPQINPTMYNWNQVYMKYCDGGSFSGNRETEFLNANGTSVWFRGHAIVRAIQDSLIADNGMGQATDVVVSGCSAGGLATYLQCDGWAAQITAAAPNAKVRCMPDSGMFFDYHSDDAYPDGPGGTLGPGFDLGMRWVYDTMEVAVDETCMAHYQHTDDPGKCMFAQYVAPFLDTPTFALQSVYDAWSLPNILGRNGEWAGDSEMDKIVNIWGRNATGWIKGMLDAGKGHGAFLSSCSYHCGNWGNIGIAGDTSGPAFDAWYSERPNGLNGLWDQGQPFPCSSCCMTHDNAIEAAMKAEEDGTRDRLMLHASLDAPTPATPASPAAPAEAGVSLGTCVVVALCVSGVSNIALFLALSRGKEEAKGGGGESMYTQQQQPPP